MIWFTTFLIVLAIVLLVGALFVALGGRGPWPGMIWFFLILFVATWALGAWVRPIGPRVWDVPWLSFLIVAVVIALLIAAATPAVRSGRGYRDSDELPLEGDSATTSAVGSHHHLPTDPRDATATATAIGVFFWIFLIVAALVYVLGQVFPPVL
jgi:hypothetical protein